MSSLSNKNNPVHYYLTIHRTNKESKKLKRRGYGGDGDHMPAFPLISYRFRNGTKRECWSSLQQDIQENEDNHEENVRHVVVAA